MPLYDYKCYKCGRVEEVVHTLADLNKSQPCSRCGVPMRRILSTPHIQMDYIGYKCPITGKWIEGRRAHKENLEKHGCRVLETGEKEEMIKRRKSEERALDKRLEETIGREIASYSPEKQRQLAHEFEKGANLTIERS